MRVNKFERAKIFFLYITIFFTFLAIYFAFDLAPKNNLQISFLDVGQGDSILLQTPRGGKILIDGGRDKKVLQELGRTLPLLSKNIELVIATHDDADHITGLLDVLKKYQVKVLLYPLPNSTSGLSQELIKITKERNVKVVHAIKPMIIKTEDGVILKILFPVKNMDSEISVGSYLEVAGNDASIVTQIIFGEIKILLTGDLPQTGEKFLVNKYGESLKSNILKLGHHGSDSSSNPEFLQIVKPEVAIVSAGKNNSFGHPHRSVVELVEKFGIKILRTDELGTINLFTNGLNFWRNE